MHSYFKAGEGKWEVLFYYFTFVNCPSKQMEQLTLIIKKKIIHIIYM